MTMNEIPPTDVVELVRLTARLLALPLADDQVDRVAVHLARTKAMADLLADVPLQAEDELVEIFCPAPFPEADPA
jgi:hypothetical protein